MLPEPVFDVPAEPLMGSDESQCDPNAHRPGVLAFRDFVIEHLGGSSIGIARPCTYTSVSGHHSARAWDWKMDAGNADESARVDELFNWLLNNDAEMFRRAGLAYIIWDKLTWSAFKPYWHPYDGFDEAGQCKRSSCRDPHTNHVHFSFNWPGADGETSFYSWLDSDQPVKEPVVTPPTTAEPTSANIMSTLLPFAAGGALGFLGVRLIGKLAR